ncbi:hypothetical protein C3432_01840 [Citrobacter amalonaticus]|uniref:Uncharacterized protein n=1 Tax=Citrobacter amalonaticus TaxID=35703 RepID=A0A2S4S2I3_CITAM|nr:cell envelope integrity protein TolA [Citrobacter amalonaticus]POT59488.1 hypothetical protein C3432_01840 [Citrobacter amalonaticus]POT77618.1 hypothetical protein C3436_09510 [Citrobacter amalonaticus]POU68070.1 hypothetical protein C3430_03045 [Citrobacter amalonaticus]POV07674.1 hypothetical protein C3424_03055 [Citrobacter amalonaticus]
MKIHQTMAVDPGLLTNTKIQNEASTKTNATKFSEDLKDVKQNAKTPHKNQDFVTRGVRALLQFITAIRSQITPSSPTRAETSAHKNVSSNGLAERKTANNVPFRESVGSVTPLASSSPSANKAQHNKGPAPQPPVDNAPAKTESTPLRPANAPQHNKGPAPQPPVDNAPAKTESTPLRSENAQNNQQGSALQPPSQPAKSPATAEIQENGTSDVSSKEVAPKAEQQQDAVNNKAWASIAEAIKKAKPLQPTGDREYKRLPSKEDAPSELMKVLRDRLGERRVGIVGKNDMPGQPDNSSEYRVAREIAEAKKQYVSPEAVQERKESKARLDAELEVIHKNKAALAEADAKKKAALAQQEAEAAKAKSFVAELKFDKKGIPLPPPMMPTAPLNKPAANIAEEPKTEIIKATKSLADELKLFHEMIASRRNGTPGEGSDSLPGQGDIARWKADSKNGAELHKQAEANLNARTEARIKKQEEENRAKVEAQEKAKAEALEKVKAEELQAQAKVKRDSKGIPVPPPLPPVMG